MIVINKYNKNGDKVCWALFCSVLGLAVEGGGRGCTDQESLLDTSWVFIN